MTHRPGWALPVLLLVSACDDMPRLPKGQYPLSVQDAYARLAVADFKEFRSDRQCGVLIHVRQTARSERAITWYVLSSGVPQLSFTATLTPVDGRRTKVDVTLTPGRDGREPYNGTQTYARPAVRQPVRPAIEEQVAAALGERPFDAGHLPPTDQDTVCLVQRAGLQNGMKFTIHDEPGEFSRY